MFGHTVECLQIVAYVTICFLLCSGWWGYNLIVISHCKRTGVGFKPKPRVLTERDVTSQCWKYFLFTFSFPVFRHKNNAMFPARVAKVQLHPVSLSECLSTDTFSRFDTLTGGVEARHQWWLILHIQSLTWPGLWEKNTTGKWVLKGLLQDPVFKQQYLLQKYT